jgi:hypothetical protein
LKATFCPKFFKKAILLCVLLKLKILKTHGRTFFAKTQNGGVNQDGGFQ